MAGPWDKYAQQSQPSSASKPWEKYAKKPTESNVVQHDNKRDDNSDIPMVDESGSVSTYDYKKAPETTIGQDIVGAGEAALSVGTGMTGGAAGMVGGTIKGVIDELRSGKLGTKDAADRIEQHAMDASGSLTYAPRTQSGQQQVAAVGEAMAPLAAIGPLTGELAAIGSAVKPLATMAAGKIDSIARPIAAAAKTAERIEPTISESNTTTASSAISKAAQAKGKKSIPAMAQLADEIKPDESILAAADRLGIRDQLVPSQYSKSQAYREIEQGIASIPGSQLNAAQKAASQKFAQMADDLIQKHGGDIDKAALSDDFRSSSMSAIQGLEKNANDLYGNLRSAIPSKMPVSANKTVEFIKSRAEDLGGDKYLSPTERRLLSSMTDNPTYARLDTARQMIGDGMRGSGVFKDAQTGLLKKLYSALSDDQQAIAEANGAGELFTAAKAQVSARKTLESQLANVLGKDLSGAITTKAGNAVKSLSSGNFKDFDKLMGSIPKEYHRRVVMTALNDAFTSGSRMEKQLSVPGFVDWYEGLSRSPAAKSRLIKYMPKEARKTLSDMAVVAKGMREASKERISTGRINALLDNFATNDGMLSKLYGFGKQVAAAEGVSSGMGVPGAGTAGVIARITSSEKTPIINAADALIASPKFQSAIFEHARSAGVGAGLKSAEAALSKSKPYKAWLGTLDKASQSAIKSNGALNWLSQSVGNVSDDKPQY
jgi:hypothetical protein